MFFDVILNFLFQLFARRSSLGQHDGCLHDLTARLVRHAGDGAFKHVRKLHDHALNLKRADAVARGLDDVIDAADIPVIAVLVAPGGVAGVVQAVVPRFGGLLLITVVAGEQAADGGIAVGADDDLARLADRHAFAVLVDDVHVILRVGPAH